jgi:uncharacterized protein (DUF2249 family)
MTTPDTDLDVRNEVPAQFAAEHPNRFCRDYLDQGPEVWRVRIGRTV